MLYLEDLSETEISTQSSLIVEMQGHQSADIKGQDEGKLWVVLCFSYDILNSDVWHDHKMNHHLHFLTHSVSF